MLYFDKIKQSLDASEKHRSISILDFKIRNDQKFSQEIVIKQNGSVINLSAYDSIYMTIIPLTSDGIITNYTVTGDANGKILSTPTPLVTFLTVKVLLNPVPRILITLPSKG